MSILHTNIKQTKETKQTKEKQSNYFVIRKHGAALYLSDMEVDGTCYYSTFPEALQFTTYKTALAFNEIAEGKIAECNLDSTHPIIKSV